MYFYILMWNDNLYFYKYCLALLELSLNFNWSLVKVSFLIENVFKSWAMWAVTFLTVPGSGVCVGDDLVTELVRSRLVGLRRGLCTTGNQTELNWLPVSKGRDLLLFVFSFIHHVTVDIKLRVRGCGTSCLLFILLFSVVLSSIYSVTSGWFVWDKFRHLLLRL